MPLLPVMIPLSTVKVQVYGLSQPVLSLCRSNVKVTASPDSLTSRHLLRAIVLRTVCGHLGVQGGTELARDGRQAANEVAGGLTVSPAGSQPPGDPLGDEVQVQVQVLAGRHLLHPLQEGLPAEARSAAGGSKMVTSGSRAPAVNESADAAAAWTGLARSSGSM